MNSRQWHFRLWMFIGLVVYCGLYLVIVLPRMPHIQSFPSDLIAYFAYTDEKCDTWGCQVSLVLFDAETGDYTSHPYSSHTSVNPESLSWALDRQFVLFYSAEGMVVYSLASDTFEVYSLEGEHWWTNWLPQGLLSTRLSAESETGVGYPVLIPIHPDGTINIHAEYEIAHVPTRAPLAWTRDGRWLALQSWEEYGEGFGEIYIVDLITGTNVAISDGLDRSYTPLWSPDGRSLVYSADQGKEQIVYRYDMSTKQTEQVASFTALYAYTTHWLESDQVLVLLYGEPQNNFHVLDVGTKQSISLPDISYGFDPSPDKTHIAYVGGSRSNWESFACVLEFSTQQRKCFVDAPKPIPNTNMAWGSS